MERRAYRGEQDVALLQAFNAAAIAATDGCGFLHPGDIPHHIFNGNKSFQPAEVLTIWEDGAGVAAWVLVGPRHRGFDAQVRPDLRGGTLERDVLGYAEVRTIESMRRHGIEGDRLEIETYRCDTIRAGLLTGMGCASGDDPLYVINRAGLSGLPEPVIPDGYTIRRVRGVQEAAAVAEVHAAAFGSSWTPDLYRTVMESPGYAPEREFVAEAADGTLAAFTVTWHDPVNRTGLFEPVGTHRDHRRRGLGTALLLVAMHAMADAGLEHAEVVNENTNEASRALYARCGFVPRYLLDGYSKPIPG